MDISRKELGQKLFTAVVERCGGYGTYVFHTLDSSNPRYVEIKVERRFDSVLDSNYELTKMNDEQLASLLEFVQDETTHPQIIRKTLF